MDHLFVVSGKCHLLCDKDRSMSKAICLYYRSNHMYEGECTHEDAPKDSIFTLGEKYELPNLPDWCPLQAYTEHTEDEVYYAPVRWTVDDIRSLRPKWSSAKCRKFLLEMERAIHENMVEDGLSLLEDMLSVWASKRGKD